jgi:hypothetical protein
MSLQMNLCSCAVCGIYIFEATWSGAAFLFTACNLFVTSALPPRFETKLLCVMRNIRWWSIKTLGKQFMTLAFGLPLLVHPVWIVLLFYVLMVGLAGVVVSVVSTCSLR